MGISVLFTSMIALSIVNPSVGIVGAATIAVYMYVFMVADAPSPY